MPVAKECGFCLYNHALFWNPGENPREIASSSFRVKKLNIRAYAELVYHLYGNPCHRDKIKYLVFPPVVGSCIEEGEDKYLSEGVARVSKQREHMYVGKH
jgi:hypothetical protein